MAEVVQETPQEFWKPPSPTSAPELVLVQTPAMAEVCPGCGTEFLLGSRFCHSCGRNRPEALSPVAKADAADLANLWEQAVGRVHSAIQVGHQTWKDVRLPGWLQYLHFHEIKRWIGLPTASLVAFVVGIACVAGALSVGLLNAKNLTEWQAIQFYRAEWLLGATASFVAGILLKKTSDSDSE
jgi:hypothetical protein